ncbi:hypothetical protein G9A89_020116 [Geosiphon pyriformis]|nr:hypothetical protein G9A89_020116 [Geosiphon pyriformis]
MEGIQLGDCTYEDSDENDVEESENENIYQEQEQEEGEEEEEYHRYWEDNDVYESSEDWQDDYSDPSDCPEREIETYIKPKFESFENDSEKIFVPFDSNDYNGNSWQDRFLQNSHHVRRTCYRNDLGHNSEASDLSDIEHSDSEGSRDLTEDTHSLVGMPKQISGSIKRLRRSIINQQVNAPWFQKSFLRKDKGHPRQIVHSPSSSNHFQCANSLAVCPTDFGLNHDIYTYTLNLVIKAGQRSKFDPTSSNPLVDKDEIRGKKLFEEAESDIEHFPTPYLDENAKILIQPFRKHFNAADNLSFNHLSEHAAIVLQKQPYFITHKFGYLCVGGGEDAISVYSTMNNQPDLLLQTKIDSSYPILINSADIFRWEITTTTELEKKYFYLLIVTANQYGVFFFELPPYRNSIPNTKETKYSSPKLIKHSSVFEPGDPSRAMVNDARISPNGKWVVVVSDSSSNWIFDVVKKEKRKSRKSRKRDLLANVPFVIGEPRHLNNIQVLNRYMAGEYRSQYVSWNSNSTMFAQSSDTHCFIIVWGMPKAEILHVIDTGGPTFAIKFNPLREQLLAFANRFGFFHLVDFSQSTDPKITWNTSTLPFQGVPHEEKPQHEILDTSTSEYLPPSIIQRAKHVFRHEIYMISRRARNHPKYRIFSTINGIEWSSDGENLYIASKCRVLTYTIIERPVKSLFEMCACIIRQWAEEKRDAVKHGREIPEMWKGIDRKWNYVSIGVKEQIFHGLGFGSHFEAETQLFDPYGKL